MSAAVIILSVGAGLALGSFVNVVVSRAPRRMSVVWPPSHCEGCGRSLNWWENVPVLSYLVLKGRCRTCGAGIGLRHLIVEISLGLAGGLVGVALVMSGALKGALVNG